MDVDGPPPPGGGPPPPGGGPPPPGGGPPPPPGGRRRPLSPSARSPSPRRGDAVTDDFEVGPKPNVAVYRRVNPELTNERRLYWRAKLRQRAAERFNVLADFYRREESPYVPDVSESRESPAKSFSRKIRVGGSRPIVPPRLAESPMLMALERLRRVERSGRASGYHVRRQFLVDDSDDFVSEEERPTNRRKSKGVAPRNVSVDDQQQPDVVENADVEQGIDDTVAVLPVHNVVAQQVNFPQPVNLLATLFSDTENSNHSAYDSAEDVDWNRMMLARGRNIHFGDRVDLL